MPSVSVVIPVYNAEQYLRRCVDSVLAQTYRDIEVILVDDGSPDKSPEICDSYAAIDERVRVIHKNNGGVSSARNTGLYAATGKYVSFVDADDWIEPEMYEKLLADAVEYDADIVMCDPVVIAADGSMTQDCIPQLKESCLLVKADFSPALLRYFAGVVWRCIYSKELLTQKQLGFHLNLRLSEDRIFNIEAMGSASRIYYRREALYHYYILETGACRKYYPDYFQIVLDTDRLTQVAIKKLWVIEYINVYKRVVVIQGALGAIYQICSSKNLEKNILKRYVAICNVVDDSTVVEAFAHCKPVGIREKLLKRKMCMALLIVGYLFNMKNR